MAGVGRSILTRRLRERSSAQWQLGCQAARRNVHVSALTSAVNNVREDVLRACIHDQLPSGCFSNASKDVFNLARGDWGAVRGQAAVAAGWPSHPLEPAERLALASSVLEQVEELHAAFPRQGLELCDFFSCLLEGGSVLGINSAGTASAAVVIAAEDAALTAALSEAVTLLLQGYVVTVAAPVGPALEKLLAITRHCPPALLQVVELAPLVDLPNAVRVLRVVGGPSAAKLWAGHAPPQDFGGRCLANGRTHGGASTAIALRLARLDILALSRSPRSRYAFGDDVVDLTALLSTDSVVTASSLGQTAGLPPPRWAKSPYDRAMEEIHDFLDLLWGFRDPLTVNLASGGPVEVSVALAPTPKHLILSPGGGTEVPEEIVRTAILSTLSPFVEPVTLHAVGLGGRGLSRDPLRGFCRMVQSGRSGLEWAIIEHKSKADFLGWMEEHRECSPLALASPPRWTDFDVRRTVAATGGVAWGNFFVADPVEQLRRWTHPVFRSEVTVKQSSQQSREVWSHLRPCGSIPEVSVVSPPPPDTD
eukprot:TRINITY_DN43527_c0_g1_i1.p1 TRINITY_DN43527_c0_g1~~TRINITY_DN43527_c0_g1_i1.p1  ORF type:complete len:548 (-),score=91.94 TRINITY_DN43527_c0_g1_i1:104-1711(-)